MFSMMRKPDVTSSSSKMLLDELHGIFSECQLNCDICDKLILKLSQHVREEHGSNESEVGVQLTRRSPRSKRSVNYMEQFEEQDTRSAELTTLSEETNNKTATNSILLFLPQDPLSLENIEDVDIKPDVDLHFLDDIEFENSECENVKPNEEYSFENMSLTESINSTSLQIKSTKIKKSTLNLIRKKKRKMSEKLHIKSPPKKKSYKCKICERVFSCKNIFDRHNKSHGKESYPCTHSECGKIFKWPGHFGDHMRMHTGEKPFQCDICQKCFARKGYLDKHKKYHKGDRMHVCDTCGQGFVMKMSLTAHMRIHTGEKPYACPHCDKRFRLKENLNIHVRTHTGERPYMCELCSPRFNQKSTLNGHMRTHSGEKRYTCEECGKGFTQSTSLANHIDRRHEDNSVKVQTRGENNGVNKQLRTTKPEMKSYECETCGKHLNNKSVLTTHMTTHTGEKPFTCAHCGKSFASNGTLKTHKEIHTGDRKYKCEQCDASYSRIYNLKNHISSKHKEKDPAAENLNLCQICNKSFSWKHNLNIHMKSVHSGLKTFKCGICDKAFPYPYRLKNHMNERHEK